MPASELIRRADSAMYASKASKSSLLAKYDPELHPNRMQDLEVERALRKALDLAENAASDAGTGEVGRADRDG